MQAKCFQRLTKRISYHEVYTITSQTELELRHNVALTKTMLLVRGDTKHKIPAIINATSLVSNTLKPYAT